MPRYKQLSLRSCRLGLNMATLNERHCEEPEIFSTVGLLPNGRPVHPDDVKHIILFDDMDKDEIHANNINRGDKAR